MFLYETGSLCVAQASPTFTSCLRFQGTVWATTPTIRICIYQWWNKVQRSQGSCPKLSVSHQAASSCPTSAPSTQRAFLHAEEEASLSELPQGQTMVLLSGGFWVFQKIFSFPYLAASGSDLFLFVLWADSHFSFFQKANENDPDFAIAFLFIYYLSSYLRIIFLIVFQAGLELMK